MNEYDGHWITTFTGKRFHYLDPSPDEINIKDIAHALALTCRFGGHVSEFYSVAEHSVRVAHQVPLELCLSALLHDAHEAYLHDVPRPIKADIIGYKEIANKIQEVINNKFGCIQSQEIRDADNILLMTEARDLGIITTAWATSDIEPLPRAIYPWSWEDAEEEFLNKFHLWSESK